MKGYGVIKRISLLVTAALMAAMMTVAMAAPAFANPPCPAGSDSPTATKTGSPGEFQCQTTVSGKNEKQPKFQKTTTTTTKGSSGPHEVTDTKCGKPCPPGQFK
jgi:hypothetical protein